MNSSASFAGPGVDLIAMKTIVTTTPSRPAALILLVLLGFFAGSFVSQASHPRIPCVDFEGVVTAISPGSVTVKGAKATRVFTIKTGKFSFEAGPGYAGLGDRGVTRTQINSSITIDLNPADVFKVGDRVTVTYWPTLNHGKEAGDIGYAELEKRRAWNRANQSHLREE